MKNNATPAMRRKARHYAMQALYQWQMTGKSLATIEAEFRADNDMAHTDTDYFHELVHQVPTKLDELEETYQPFMKAIELDELDPITAALLRLATYEFMYRVDVPYKVVINEAVSLAKKFGATDSYKFVNGVLDQVAAKCRAVELNAEKKA